MPETPAAGEPGDRIRTDQPHTARIWNHWLGGEDNHAVGQEVGEQIREPHPGIGEYARAGRQLLDIGTGLPTAGNTHEAAQRTAPESRVVHVDNDPIVLAHAATLPTSAFEGRTSHLDEDLRDTGTLLA